MLNKSKISIVIADDHPIMRNGLCQEIQEAGYDLVAAAENGALALEAIVKHKPAIALLDIEMPKIDGEEFIRIIRKKKSHKRTPIIIATGEANDIHRGLVRVDKSIHLLEKPFPQQDFIDLIDKLT